MTNKKNTPSYPLVLELDAKLSEISKTYSEFLPLEIGVYDIIVKMSLGYSNRVKKECIARHCGKEDYLFNVLSSNSRFRLLSGDPCGDISEEAKAHSIEMLKRINKNRANRGK
jgi:sRNA-binding protein